MPAGLQPCRERPRGRVPGGLRLDLARGHGRVPGLRGDLGRAAAGPGRPRSRRAPDPAAGHRQPGLRRGPPGRGRGLAPRGAGRASPRGMIAAPPAAPAPAHRPTERTCRGDTVVDPFEWMREKTDPEVIAHLEAENAYPDARTAHLDRLRAALVDE